MPPDETSLIGVGVGMAQAGLLPVVEIPYAKYLDCGADMFYEAVIANWLSNGTKPNGMVIRLQGFDRGVFGGNFHTHNMIPLPPGLDVVVFSNGSDWVKGWRNAVEAAKAGRVVMVIDSTDLLNRRHVDPDAKDAQLMLPYPTRGEAASGGAETLGFDTIIRHGQLAADGAVAEAGAEASSAKDLLTIVTYGNGVVAAKVAQRCLAEEYGVGAVGIVEVPCVSEVPPTLASTLRELNGEGGAVLFADVCKAQQAPLNHFAVSLQAEGTLSTRGTGKDWSLVAAPQTYNPLGTTVTFLSPDDIIEAARPMLGL